MIRMTLKNLEESEVSPHMVTERWSWGWRFNSKAGRSSEVRTLHPRSCTATQGLIEPLVPPTLLPEVITTGQPQEEPRKDADEFLSCF